MNNATQTQPYDALIVGGGLVGMLTARDLKLAGLHVALVEKNKLGAESSWAAGGILSKLYPWQQGEAMQQLITQGQTSFPTLARELFEETGIDAQLLHSGMIITDLAEQQKALEWSQKNKTQIQVIERKQIDQLEPNLNHNIPAALYMPKTMQVRPPKLIKALKQSLLNRGVDIYEGIAANKLVLQAKKVIGIETKDKTMFADQIAVCNGAWAQQFLSQISQDLTDIEPVRGQMLLFKPQQNVLSHIIVKDGFYLIPRKDQYVLCGSTVEQVGFNKNTTPEARELLSTQAYGLCPTLRETKLVQHWSALRPGTAQELPYVDAHPEIEGLYINAGHYRYGIVTSIPTARMVSKLITNKLNTSQIFA